VFRYSVYGVVLSSDTGLPELERLASTLDTGQVSINVRLGDADIGDQITARWFLRSTFSNSDGLALCGKIEGGYLLRYLGFADFIVDSAGRELRCARVEPGTSPQTLRHLLLDRVLPLVLNLVGHDVLHATAVVTARGVCAFIGPAGAGKSTIAASFAAAGYTIFCDDCLVVKVNGGILCTPGYPGVRLWTDSFPALGDQFATVCTPAGTNSKFRILGDGGTFPDGLHPLIAIYRISRATDRRPALSAARVEHLTGSEAFIELASSAYVLDVTEQSTLRRHFRFIERLVTGIPVGRLWLPNDLGLLPAARRMILSGLESA